MSRISCQVLLFGPNDIEPTNAPSKKSCSRIFWMGWKPTPGSLSPGVDGRFKKIISQWSTLHPRQPTNLLPPWTYLPTSTYQTPSHLPTPFSYQPLFINGLPSCSSLDGNIAKASLSIAMFSFRGHDCDCHRRLLDFGIAMVPLSIASIK
jgi:hypothetical protein